MADTSTIQTARMDKKIEEMAKATQAAFDRILSTSASQMWDPKHVDKLAKRLADIQSKIQEANLKGDKDRAEALQKRLEKMHIEIANPRDLKRLSKGAADAAQTFGEGLSGAFQSLKSKDLGQIAGMFKKMGQSASAAGTKMEGTAVKGMGGDAIAGLGKAMSTIGPAIAAIAGAAVGIAALVKIVMDADSRIKDLNKSMLEAGIAGQEFGDDVGQGMGQVRQAFTGMGAIKYLDQLGTTSKETIAVLGGFQKAGTTFKEMTGAAKNDAEAVDKLREAVKGAIVYSKLLGESAEKVAGDMAKMAEETSSTLEGVRDKFTEIAAAAKQSGFDTKRFYGMVLEVTTGMSMYNVRLQDTIGLLSQAGKVLGPDAGKAWAQSLAGGLKEVSTRDTVVNTMKMGKGQVQGAAKEDAKFQAAALKDSFMAIQTAGGKPADQMAAALEKAGLSASMTPEDLAKGMGNMSKDSAEILRAELNRVEGVSGLGTKTAHAQYVARAGEGKGGLGGEVNAMKNFGVVGTLMTKVRGSHAVDSGTDFDKLDPENVVKQIAAESLKTGAGAITSQDADMLRDAIGALKSKDEAVTMEGIAKELGLAQKTSEEEAKKAEDLKKERENAWLEDQRLATQVVENTQSLADIMENRIEQILTTISEGINKLVSWTPWGKKGQSDEAKAARGEAIDETNKKIGELTEELGKIKGTGARQDAGRKAIKEQIAEQRELSRTMGRDTTTEGTSEDFIRNARMATLTDAERKELETQQADAKGTARSKGQTALGEKWHVSQDNTAVEERQAKFIEDKFLMDKTMDVGRSMDVSAAQMTPQQAEAQKKIEDDQQKAWALKKAKTLAGMSDADQTAMSGDIDVATAGKTPEEAKKIADGIAKKYFDKQKKIDDARVQKQTDTTIKADDKRAKDAEIARITSGLMDPTGTNKVAAEAAARAIVEGTESAFTGDKKLLTQGRKIQSGDTTPMKDGELAYSDSSGHMEFAAIADDDVVDIHHKGRGGRGGGGTINVSVNQWGDVPGAILKAMETMRVRT